MAWLIYRIVFPNGKSYVGLTKNLTNRKSTHKRDMTKRVKRPLYGALNKYGWENVTFEVVRSEIDTLEMANRWEKYYVYKYKSHISLNGYNASFGGDGSLGTKMSEDHKAKTLEMTHQRWKDPEYRAKMYEATSQRKFDENTKRKMSISAKNRIQKQGHSWKGRSHSEDSRSKMSATKKKMDYSTIKTGKRVTCSKIGFTFFSRSDCCDYLGISTHVFYSEINNKKSYGYGLCYTGSPKWPDQQSTIQLTFGDLTCA